ncbi:hypothetical protein FXW30_04565 [Candidatus Liberibacter asiaticus]|uniref:Uncharacterized protein n=2 Tax=Liberibacter asiaticus TaxID=34021 RepID=C6XGL6_LIBAP|nr:hypothetical protein CLIBASIA_04740 [Candidatus Liberibacter asiaticus str. psy62]AGH17282.1 hypothetical protein WSI_04570 [Candidatus Liberibacter asiaticus str. gxpsy]KAE9509751.1 hypothetical protein FXW22_04575 [Candidatus Liberibacter asiaticus]BAP26815.1 hypothetical protein CGUJ_04740 [Candidatus Liberibacter asiaticus str. Ishi-1]KAE9511426.1 hypothetical protein FXW31_01535 [Candidatus Liberibacter asiaticus]
MNVDLIRKIFIYMGRLTIIKFHSATGFKNGIQFGDTTEITK